MTIGQTLTATAELLSPLHVGSGQPELLAGVDYLRHNDRLAVIDPERMLASLPSDRLALALAAAPLERLIQGAEIDACTRYSLPAPAEDPPRIRPLVHDSRGRPYLPGSSLKGALRTALLRALVQAGAPIDVAALPGADRSADSPVEDAQLGGSPQRDLLRTLLVRDSSPLAASERGLERVMLHSLDRGVRELRARPESVIVVESIPAGARLELELRLDRYLLDGPAARANGFAGRGPWVAAWLAAAHAMSLAVIAHEARFYASYGPEGPARFYEELAQRAAQLDGRRAGLLQLAWGSGWLGMTVGIDFSAADLATARERYGLGRRGHPVFPKSRRLAMRGERADRPLGWLQISLEGAMGAELPAVERRPAAAPPQRPPTPPPPGRDRQRGGELPQLGQIILGTVRSIKPYGAFVAIGGGRDGLLHISQLNRRVDQVEELLQVGQRVRVKVERIGEDGKIALTMRGVPQEPQL